MAFVEPPHRLDDLDRSQIEDRLGVGMIAVRRSVTGHQHHVRDPEGGRRQQIRLDRDPVAVAGGHLEDGLDSLVQQAPGRPDGSHAHAGVVGIGQVECVHEAGERARGFEHRREIEPFRGGELARDDKASRSDEVRDSRHGACSPCRWSARRAEYAPGKRGIPQRFEASYQSVPGAAAVPAGTGARLRSSTENAMESRGGMIARVSMADRARPPITTEPSPR